MDQPQDMSKKDDSCCSSGKGGGCGSSGCGGCGTKILMVLILVLLAGIIGYLIGSRGLCHHGMRGYSGCPMSMMDSPAGSQAPTK